MKHIVMYSGGAGSWAAAKRVVLQHGANDVLLLFTDTRIEDEDLYRFIVQSAADVGAALVPIADGRDPWQVFFDKRYLGNSRRDPCSAVLKRDLAAKWLAANCDPADTTLYVGIDWSEEHRFFPARDRYAALGWTLKAPLCEPPYLSKQDILIWLELVGIEIPRLYEMGFAHNNCGGFCVKAGQGHFATLLRAMPERYAYHEAKEQEIRAYLGKDVSILKDRRGGKTAPLTLRDFRLRLEAGGVYDKFEIGGCGCFTPTENMA